MRNEKTVGPGVDRIEDDPRRYEDIIDLPHHVSAVHPRMSMRNRAGQFAPFAALTGYGESIAEAGRLTERRVELTEAEKEYKSKRREIQEKLIKFATRIPIFMYLTDFREETLKDVVTQLEPGLFRKVTGLDIKDFNLLVELNVFNSSLMNDAIFKFRRYEDSSLSYAGVNRHDADERVGGFDAVLSKE